MILVVYPLSFVSISILKVVCTESLPCIFVESSNILLIITVDFDSLSIFAILFVSAFVYVMIRVSHNAIAMFESILVLSFVGAILFRVIETFAIIQMILHLAKVEISIVEIYSYFVASPNMITRSIFFVFFQLLTFLFERVFEYFSCLSNLLLFDVFSFVELLYFRYSDCFLF
jgi:hypothetical protein